MKKIALFIAFAIFLCSVPLCTVSASEPDKEQIIADGVYYIKNVYSNYYLQVSEAANYPESYVCHNNWTNDGIMNGQVYSGDRLDVRYMWKINYLGEGYYSICPMHRLNMHLSLTAYEDTGETIATVNSTSPTTRWKIEQTDAGYVFKADGYDFFTLFAPNINRSTHPYIVTSLYEENVSNCLWDIEEAGTAILWYENSLFTPNPYYWATPNSILTIEQLNLKFQFSPFILPPSNVTWTSSNTDIATVDPSTGRVETHAPGKVTISATILYNENEISAQYSLTVTPLIDGFYYIQNNASGNCITYTEDDSTSNNIVSASSYEDINNQKWLIEHFGYGYYTIRLADSSGTYLGNNSSTLILSDVAYLWRIVQTPAGGLKIATAANEDIDLAVFSTSTSESSYYNTYLQEYTKDENYQDEWSFIPVNSPIQLEGQKNLDWCWVACAKMVSHKYFDSRITHHSAAVYALLDVKTLNPTDDQLSAAKRGGTIYDLEKALEYMIGFDNVYAGHGQIYSETVLQSLLDENNPVIVLFGRYKDDGSRKNGHFLVINDYFWNSELGCYVYEIYDPLPLGTGSIYAKTYASICRELVYEEDEETPLLAIWESIVVFEHGDYRNTTSWLGLSQE